LTPFCQSRKKVGDVWNCRFSDTSALLATSRMVKPPGRPCAVHGDLEGGVIKGLLDAEVGEAGHLAQVGQDLVGDLAVAVEVRALRFECRSGLASQSSESA